MDVQELTPSLWRWSTRHPDWTEEEGGDDGWEPDVWSVYLETPDAVVLIDPLVPAEPDERERFLRHLDADVKRVGLPVRVLITVYWHERSSREVADRYGGEIWAYRGALPHLDARVEQPFALGDALPGGVQAVDAGRREEMLYWLPRERALVTGDVLLGSPDGVRVCPDSWLPQGTDPAQFRAGLRPLLDLPVEMVLPAHGPPVLADGRAALARALDPPS